MFLAVSRTLLLFTFLVPSNGSISKRNEIMEKESTRCGLLIGLSIDINEYLRDDPALRESRLKILVDKEGDSRHCKLVLGSSCLPSKCPPDLCSSLSPGQGQVSRHILEEKEGGKWEVGCAVIEEKLDSSLLARSGDTSPGGFRYNEGIELMPQHDEELKEACKTLFHRNRTEFGLSYCCRQFNEDPRCLLSRILENELRKDSNTPSSYQEASNIRSGPILIKEEKLGNEDFRGQYITLVVFFVVFLAIFLMIIIFLIYKIKSSPKSVQGEHNSSVQEISHRRYSDCLPETPPIANKE